MRESLSLNTSNDNMGYNEVSLFFVFYIILVGWGYSSESSTGFGRSSSTHTVKYRLVHLIYAIRTIFRIPLIILNTVAVLFLLVLG
jgi:immediate early response 3-interacting protein 1